MIGKAPELDLRGNDPFWIKNEGFGLTLYFPAFRPEKSHYQNECRGSDKLVFGVMRDAIPISFIMAMMEQGNLNTTLRKECWLRPAITPSGRVVISISIAKWKTEEDKDAWYITQDAYNHASSWYRKRVRELWKQAKLAASFFGSGGSEPTQGDDIVDVDVVPPAEIEA